MFINFKSGGDPVFVSKSSPLYKMLVTSANVVLDRNGVHRLERGSHAENIEMASELQSLGR